ncbi:polysaccharide biosynthesis tyrosine autokinase [Spiribacter sp. 221]|uniref:GumC family protein n=1 Tax=Spiribacter onubensis TaxID=3122420 RepID=UPI00349FC8AB
MRQPAEDERIDLHRLWITIYRYKWSIIILPLLVMMLVWLYNGTLTPIYRATATMLVEPPSESIGNIEEVLNPESRNQSYLATQFQLLGSRSLSERVVEELNLVRHPALDPRQQERDDGRLPSPTDWQGWLELVSADEWLPFVTPQMLGNQWQIPLEELTDDQVFGSVVAQVRGAITVEARGETSLVDINVEHSNRRLAAAIANGLMAAYIDRQLSARLEMSETATNWMSGRLEDLRADLEAAEERLQSHREREGIVDLGGVARLSAEGLTQLNARLVEARQRLAEAENRFEQISGVPDAQWRELLTTSAVRGESSVAQLRAEEVRAASRVEQLAERYGPKHPAMQDAEEELAVTTQNLRTQVQSVVATIRRDYELAQVNVRSLEQAVAEYGDRTRDSQAKEFTVNQLEREVQVARTLYETFLSRLREISAVSDVEQVNAEVVDPAMLPSTPVKPKRLRNTQVSGVLALLIAVGFALLRDQMNNRIVGTGDAEEKLGLPILGVMPLQSRKLDLQETARIYIDKVDRAFNEAVRTIRTGVVLSHLDEERHIVLVTSSLPGEGKTSTAVNLAAAFSETDNILLIEGDMRRPSFRRLFDFDQPEIAGLAEAVAGDVSLDEAIHKVDGIAVLPCGRMPPNPLELLSSQRFADMLETLCNRYDRIIIDAPPAQVVSDPLVLTTLSTSVVYVVKAESTAAPLVRRGVNRLPLADGQLSGIVINQLNIAKSSRYGYGAGYRYGETGYYDYYGYSR